MTDSLEDLVKALRLLPSVGEKSAWRMALAIAEDSARIATPLSEALVAVRDRVKSCQICYHWCEEEICSICSDGGRDRSIICVVERARDVRALEESGQYRGLYHVLGGLLSPMKGVSASDLHIPELLKRVDEAGVCEVILGLDGSSEAETTAHYISRLISQHPELTITQFARGLSAGMEIEYADSYTLSRALSDRRSLSGGQL